MGSSVCLRPDQRLEEEQHQCEELWTDDSQLQSSFPLPPLSGERSKAPFFFLNDHVSQCQEHSCKRKQRLYCNYLVAVKVMSNNGQAYGDTSCQSSLCEPSECQKPKNKKTKQVEINRMWLQPPNTMKLAAGFDALVGCERSNTFSKKRTAACVWTCLHRLWLCNSFMRKPQGTERVCLIPGTDRGLAGGNCNLSKL